MKKLFVFLVVLLMGPVITRADQPDTTTYIYCEMVVAMGTGAAISDLNDVKIFYDFGNGKVYGPSDPLTSLDGTTHIFTSSVAALNFLARESWSLVSSTSIYYSTRVIHHHFLKRPRFGVKSNIILPIL